MSKSALTIKAFGIYLLVLGLDLALMPNVLLSMMGMPPTSEVWIRVIGVLVINIGLYYWTAAVCEAKAFFQMTVYTRYALPVAFTLFVALGFAGPALILFAGADVLGAFWTQRALRAERVA